ncbi:BPTD_3080 family restriction endonuclease [Desulfonema magnum]|uniref:Restriction endonuclease family protein n=1 Tax=Desulfonema magnum TaxID=45655 RepID=A0A975BR92_9BACT|nr:DEAD/DEAH box helicase family protein [Desulfonema magnum]QTA90171.1 Restriction endonuclease family protein [Desulfonema magnum]
MSSSFNPILNSPFEEPDHYYDTQLDGSLDYDNIISGRRPFVPDVPLAPVKPGKQKQVFTVKDVSDTYDTHLVNLIRREAGAWRTAGYPNVTRVTGELLTFWFLNPERNNKLFFAQREAIEIAVWLNEAAEKSNAGQNILNRIREGQVIRKTHTGFNLPRIAFKMATGTGKTVVMAMQILYHFFNRTEYRNDVRFADYFLILTPGITIKDRLGVLFADTEARHKYDAKDYYHIRDLVPYAFENRLSGLNAKLVITNRHSLERRVLKGNKKSPFDGKKGRNKDHGMEDYARVIQKVLGKFRKGRRVVVINDEAHHCYLPKVKTKQKENQRAAVWITGIAEIAKKFKVRAVYDLSATPYYLNGSGYDPYTLFPWVVSDFGLVEAMESGLVKIPFMPETDTTQEIEMPKLRNIYEFVKDDLPKKSAKKQKFTAHPQLPELVRIGLEQFYSHYKKEYEKVRELFDSPPVFIVVCNNTSISSEIFRYIAGYEIEREEGETQVVNGKFELFDNFDPNTRQLLRKPPTLLIDSEELENSDQITPQFKKIFASEIERFKADYRRLRPDRSVDQITDSDLLREVVNTVGKMGTLGAHVRCVVSVSMLTEGWDANTVTHIMGLRAFGSQLLCEQVVGRALRRVNYYRDETGQFPPEYAHVIGVPFKFFKGGKTAVTPPKGDMVQIRALPERGAYEICFPNITGYRIERLNDEIRADFSQIEPFEIDGSKLPAETKLTTAFSPASKTLSLEELKEKREQELIYHITQSLISLCFRDDDGNPLFYHFPVLKKIVQEWVRTKVCCIGDAFKNMLFHLDEMRYCHHIMRGIHADQQKHDSILPVFNSYNKFGSTCHVNGVTRKKIYQTTKSHVNFVVADTNAWEQIAAKTLEEMDEVVCYVKNEFLGFAIPYLKDGKDDKHYYPDFIAQCKSENGKRIQLIIEITGMNKDKAEKKWYVENRWLPAVNTVREKYEYDEWRFVEIADDIRDIKNQLIEKIRECV